MDVEEAMSLDEDVKGGGDETVSGEDDSSEDAEEVEAEMEEKGNEGGGGGEDDRVLLRAGSHPQGKTGSAGDGGEGASTAEGGEPRLGVKVGTVGRTDSFSRAIEIQVADLECKLRRRQVEGSAMCAKKTAELLRAVISKEHRSSVPALLKTLAAVGRRLSTAQPVEFALGNVVKRVMHIVREEEQQLMGPDGGRMTVESEGYYTSPRDGGAKTPQPMLPNKTSRTISLHNLLEHSGGDMPDVNEPEDSETESINKENMRKLRYSVIECVNELIEEVDTIEGLIAEQAIEHIHANEVILTSGNSRSVFEFLREAAKKRTFQVVVAEGMPENEGHILAKSLADLGIQTTLIPDAAVFAMMARINMVLNGAHAVLANGGVVTRVGVKNIAQAASYHSVPFIVLTGLYKLSPLYPHDQSTTLREVKSPAQLLDYRELEECLRSDKADENPDMDLCSLLEVANFSLDFIPPHLITLFITDIGGHAPSYIYRLLAEYYSAEDQIL